MKNTLIVCSVAVLSSILTLTGSRYLESKQTSKSNYTPPLTHMASMPVFSEQPPKEGFSSAAQQSMPAVVHITSKQSTTAQRSYGNQDIPPEFRDFFNDFFGSPHPNTYPKNPQKNNPSQAIGSGSGVIINDKGYIVTNNHVIEGADEIQVQLNDNRSYTATVIGTDPSTDIALLQISEKNLPYLSFSNSDNVKVGEWVLAVGNPFNLTSTVTAGIVSAKGRSINILKGKSPIESFIQTDAAINPGNSGGALVDASGNLIGINTAIASPTGAYSGYGFAVPSNMVKKIVEDLKQYGVVQRGYLGIMIQNMNADLAKEKDLKTTEGVYVSDFSENSSAKKAGLQKEDIIIQIDGTDVKSAPELQELIGRKRPGDLVKVRVNRNGNHKDLNVTLLDKNGNLDLKSKSTLSRKISLLGADFTETSKQTNKTLQINGGIQINNIQSGKIRTQTRINEGFIITKINHQEVTSLKKFEQLIDQSKQGVLIEGVYLDRPGVHYYALGF